MIYTLEFSGSGTHIHDWWECMCDAPDVTSPWSGTVVLNAPELDGWYNIQSLVADSTFVNFSIINGRGVNGSAVLGAPGRVEIVDGAVHDLEGFFRVEDTFSSTVGFDDLQANYEFSGQHVGSTTAHAVLTEVPAIPEPSVMVLILIGVGIGLLKHKWRQRWNPVTQSLALGR